MPALNASSRETKNHDAPRTSTASSTSSAAPRCRRRTRMHLGPATPHLDFALADHVTHFTGAAVEHFSRLQPDARPAVTGWHAQSACSLGTMEAPVAAWPVRVIRHCFTE